MTDLNENQEIQNSISSGHGGKRPGAGRRKGSTKRPQISDYISPEEVKSLVEDAKRLAPEKPELMKFLLEQVFGKARQNIGLDGGEEGMPVSVELIKQVDKALEDVL